MANWSPRYSFNSSSFFFFDNEIENAEVRSPPDVQEQNDDTNSGTEEEEVHEKASEKQDEGLGGECRFAEYIELQEEEVNQMGYELEQVESRYKAHEKIKLQKKEANLGNDEREERLEELFEIEFMGDDENAGLHGQNEVIYKRKKSGEDQIEVRYVNGEILGVGGM